MTQELFLNCLTETLGGVTESADEVISNLTETDFEHCSSIRFLRSKEIQRRINTGSKVFDFFFGITSLLELLE